MAAARGLPGGPVTVQQFGVNAGVNFAGVVGVEVPLVAGIVGPAIGIDVAGEDQVLSVGREKFAIGLGGEIGDLFGIAAIGVHQPDLRRAAAVGDVRDPLGIRRPARPLIGFAIVGDLARRGARRSV